MQEIAGATEQAQAATVATEKDSPQLLAEPKNNSISLTTAKKSQVFSAAALSPETKLSDEKFEEKKPVKIEVDKNQSYFNYIINKGASFQNGQKQTGDMTATVNEFTETNIYIGKNKGGKNWYSQISNLQTEEFDKKFVYKDKEIDASSQDGFKMVGIAGRLDATLHQDSTATINLWAPTAKEVTLNLYPDLKKDSEKHEEIKMLRGDTVNENDHTQNTVGLWTYHISKERLTTLGKETAKNIAYDFTLKIPNAYFIQVEKNIKKNLMVTGYLITIFIEILQLGKC
ncbi:hypothetical protein [Streptococcus catagoni]|uniref:hypothetical protein n=1 Tax=Streptococcus catagoni TaxID=2654874 RepID=UPI001409ED03|nr:hypothetical protein [Streptococcus catagoni]